VRVLVTGCKGFVGHWLISHLKSSGDEVTGIDLEVDITDPPVIAEAIQSIGPEAIYHLAAQASVGTSFENHAATYQVNTLGVVNVLDGAASCAHPPRVLLVSSAEVYGRLAPDQLPVQEDHPFAPVSPYAASKAAAEMVGLEMWLATGLEVIRVRPFNHTGPGQPPTFVVPSLAKQIAEAIASGAESLVTGNLDARRDLTDVRDVVRAYRSLVVSGAPDEVYNVCRGDSVPIREVAERLLALAGVDLPIVVDPARLRPSEIPDLRGDPSRLNAATGWVPEIPLEETLRDVLAYWQNSASS
jgi:GDP-4-dehydro-6-deoxy-D-mannose reductase